jgi:hypothetical protein
MTNRFLAITLLLVSIAFAVVPFFVNFSGYDPDIFPVPQDDPPGQPAGYAFAIWGVIYLWLIISAAIGLWRFADDPTWRSARLPLLVSLIVGVAWLPVAQNNPIAASVLIWMMLVPALIALARAPDHARLAFKAPIALYTGWLAAASWVTIALVGAGYGIAFDATVWAIIILLGATVLSVFVLLRLRAIPEFGVGVTWALVAVVVKNGLTTLPAWLAAICAVVVATLTLRQFLTIKR